MESIETQRIIRMGQLKEYLRLKLPPGKVVYTNIDNETIKHHHRHEERASDFDIYCNSIPLGKGLSVTFVL
jgi:hypothetical protein